MKEPETLTTLLGCVKHIGPEDSPCATCGMNHTFTEELLKKEAIKWIRNLQTNDTKAPLLMAEFPDALKGSSAQRFWRDSLFTYGAEYGMMAILIHIFNLTDEDLK